MYTYRCGQCKKLLPRDRFHKQESAKGHYSICKSCRAADPRSVIINLVSNARKRAKRHSVPCTVTRRDILELNEKQGGLCAYTGIPLNWEPSELGKQRLCPPDRVSLDRIDSDLSYVDGNMHLVTDFVNRIKTWYPEDDFVEFCRLVVKSADN